MTFLLVRKQEVELDREVAAERYRLYRAIPGTRSFHAFIPKDENEMFVKTVSTAEEAEAIPMKWRHKPAYEIAELAISRYYSFYYSGNKYFQFGQLVDVNAAEDEVELNAMRVAQKNRNLRWPVRSVGRHIPRANLLLHCQEPVSDAARKIYHISDDDWNESIKRFKEFQKILSKTTTHAPVDDVGSESE